MASSNKRMHLALETPDTTESSSGGGSSEEEEEDDDQETGDDPEEIQVEFEARTPEECDHPGIKGLLQKLFRGVGGAAVDVGALADFIIAQRNVGSVITQSHGPAGGDDDDDDDDVGNDVFGVTTVLKLNAESVLARQVRDYLVGVSTKKDRERLASFFANPNHTVGFLISERIMNIPPQISVPLYETLFNEIRKAKAKHFPFDFTHFVLVSKCLRSVGDDDDDEDDDAPAHINGKAPNGVLLGPLVFVNAEEEMLEEESEMVVEVDPASLQQKHDGGGEGGGAAGNPPKMFDLSESEYESTSKILVISADKSDRILTLLKNLFPL